MIMKNFYLVVFSLCACIGGKAQIKTDGKLELGSTSKLALSIPKEFCYDGAPMLQMYEDEYSSSSERKLLIYDENLNLRQTLQIGGDKTFDYQITYQDEVRDIINVSIKQETEDNMRMSYDDFITQTKMSDPTFDESQLTIIDEANGDKLIIYDFTLSNYFSQSFYYGYNVFGTKYPKQYFRCKNGVMYRYYVTYSVTYGDWRVSGTRTEDNHLNYKRLYLCNINLNEGDGQANYYFEASQTLFNNDETFEYLVPKYVLSASSSDASVAPTFDGDDDPIETTRSTIVSEKPYVALAGFQVVSSNGTVVRDLDFEQGFDSSIQSGYIYVVTIGKKTYLAFSGYQDGKSCTLFYQVDRQTSDIRKVSTARGSFIVTPTIADRSTPINISFGDDNKSGSDIIVYSTSGSQMQQQSVPAGKKSTQLTLNRNAGMYIVARKQQGQPVQTQKIIIK